MNTDDEYTAACARCEVWVDIVDAEHHAAILSVLHFDKRTDGSRGRSLRRAVAPLLIHDRLEPNPTMPDVGDVDLLSVFSDQGLILAPSVRNDLHAQMPFIRCGDWGDAYENGGHRHHAHALSRADVGMVQSYNLGTPASWHMGGV